MACIVHFFLLYFQTSINKCSIDVHKHACHRLRAQHKAFGKNRGFRVLVYLCTYLRSYTRFLNLAIAVEDIAALATQVYTSKTKY